MKRGSNQYHLMRPDEIVRVREDYPVAFVPWGAIEWHSYHNPVGLDGLIADGLCRALADELGGIVFPPMYLATDTIKEFKGFPHSIEHRESTVGTVCMELLEQLTAERFRAIVIVTGHAGGKHTDILSATIASFNESSERSNGILFTPFAPIQDDFPANHAAEGETSLLLHLLPDLVDLSALPTDRQTTLDEDGVWGNDPRNATAERGAEIVKAFVVAVSPQVQALINQD